MRVSLNYPVPHKAKEKGPGDVEHWPRTRGERGSSYPLCALLFLQGPGSAAETSGAAFLQRLNSGGEALSLVAYNLPSPSDRGDYNSYQGVVETRGVRYGFMLSPADSQVWYGFLFSDEPRTDPGGQVTVLPVNAETGTSGEPVLAGVLRRCQMG